MRYVLKHLLVGLRRNNFHRKLFLHLTVIGKCSHIDVRSLFDPSSDGLYCLINYAVVRSAVLNRIVELLDRHVHADVASLRSNGDRLVALIELVDLIDGNLHVCALLCKSVLHICNKLLFEIFVIHFVISFLFAMGPDRHPFPVDFGQTKSAGPVSSSAHERRSHFPVFFCKRKWTRRLGFLFSRSLCPL